MRAGSQLAFLKPKTSKRDIFDEEPDTNVIAVDFKSLLQAEENMHMGDPNFCKNCNCCLSSHSVLLTKKEYIATKATDVERQVEEEKKSEPITKEKIMAMVHTPGNEKESQKVWICEFCGANNSVKLEEEEIPKTEDIVYFLHPAKKDPFKDPNADITTIFCIDNSGSMSVTSEVKGKGDDIPHGMSEEEYEMLKQFIEAGADQYLPGQKKDTVWVSRKQCVLNAIESQLLELKNEHPNRKVGLVTFNNEVCIVGDGKNVPEIIAGDKLFNGKILKEICEGVGSKLINATVKESAEDLIKKFKKLQESGKTALGPALLVSLELARQGKQGSRVILCTDGLANIGLGEMDSSEGLEKAEEFYTELANHAKGHGVSISVMSIKGEGCKLDILGKVAEITSGTLTRVDPNEMGSKFATVMKQEVIGTQVEVKLRLHRGMKFRNEAEENLKEKASLFEKNIGNVTAKTELTFEYEMRPDEELVELGVDVYQLETVPFQAQITYTSTNGDQLMRVINKTLKTTTNQAEAEENLNVNLLAARALQQQAELASKGLLRDSEQVGYMWGTYLENRVYKNNDKKSSNVVDRFRQHSENLTRVTTRKKHTIAVSPSKLVSNKDKEKDLQKMKINEAIFGKKKKDGNRGEEDDEDYETIHQAKNSAAYFEEEEY